LLEAIHAASSGGSTPKDEALITMWERRTKLEVDPWLRGLAGRVGSYRLICTYLFFDTAFYTYQKRLLLAGSSKSERKTLLRQCMESRA
jgi:hypothetical protein